MGRYPLFNLMSMRSGHTIRTQRKFYSQFVPFQERLMMSVGRICSLVLAVVFATSAAYGQSSHGSMAGTVTDPTGAVIPGAKVLVTEQATGTKTETVSTSSGDYRFNELPVGSYTVTATAAGFTTATATGVQVTVHSISSLHV